MDYTDPRLRLLLDPGTLEATYGSYGKNLDIALDELKRISEEEWLPALTNLLGNEEDAKEIVNLLNPSYSNATVLGYLSNGRLDIKEVDNYFKDACQNGGFLCENGKRTKIFRGTEFAKDLGSALNQLNLIGVINLTIARIDRAMNAEEYPQKIEHIKYLKNAYYALRGPVLTNIENPAFSVIKRNYSWCSLTTWASSCLYYNEFTKKEMMTMMTTNREYIEEKKEPDIQDRAILNVYKTYFPGGYHGEMKDGIESPDLDKMPKLELITKTFCDELSTFLDMPEKEIDDIIRKKLNKKH